MKRDESPKLQIILIFICNFLLACPYNRISTVETIEEAGENPHRIKLVFLLAHASQNIVAAISTLIIGFLMKAKLAYLWHAIAVNVVLIFVVETIRKVWMKKDVVNQ